MSKNATGVDQNREDDGQKRYKVVNQLTGKVWRFAERENAEYAATDIERRTKVSTQVIDMITDNPDTNSRPAESSNVRTSKNQDFETLPSTRPMTPPQSPNTGAIPDQTINRAAVATLRQQLEAFMRQFYDMCEEHNQFWHEASETHYTDKLEALCQEIAREADKEARLDELYEAVEVPLAKLPSYLMNCIAELTQKPPQPPLGGLEEVSDGSS